MNKQAIIDGLDVLLGRRGEKITQGDILIVEAAIMALASAQPEALALLRELNDALVIPGWLQPRVDAVLDRADA